MHVLIAPNAFKHSIDASAAARAIDAGLRSGDPGIATTLCPVGDGGDGTGKLLTHAASGQEIILTVQDPLGRPVRAAYGWLPGDIAVVEMASASGIHLLQTNELDPIRASSFGTGELMRHALDQGAQKILLCVGGSATVDGGSGILHALGARFRDIHHNIIEQVPERLSEAISIDLVSLHPALQKCEVIVLCDVSNPLLGPSGAVPVFGPQKGAVPNTFPLLTERLERLCALAKDHSGNEIGDMPYGGAAGGVTAGLCGFINAKAVNGTDYFLDTVSFNTLVAQSSVVITGEGSIDRQTLEGKAPFGVATRAKELGVPVIALSGKMPDLSDHLLRAAFQSILPINETQLDLATALRSTEKNLTRVATELAQHWRRNGLLF